MRAAAASRFCCCWALLQRRLAGGAGVQVGLHRLPLGVVEQVVQVFQHLGLAGWAGVHGGLHSACRPAPARSRKRVSAAAAYPTVQAQHLAELLQGAAHLGLDGAHGAVVHLGDLLVGQLAVLAEEKDLLLLGPQVQQRLAELLQRSPGPPGPASAGRRSSIGMVSAPTSGLTRRRQALRCRSLAALSPTRKIQARRFCTSGRPSWVRQQRRNDFLGDVLGVLRVAQDEPERADQLVAQGVEGAQQHLAGRGVRRDLGGRTGTHTRGRSAHTVTLTDEGFGAPDCRRMKNARKGAAGVRPVMREVLRGTRISSG